MVTIASTRRFETGLADYEFKGLSTDEKPTLNVGVNSLFFECDTGDFYYFDGEEWSKVGGESE